MSRTSKPTSNKPPPDLYKNMLGGQPLKNKLLLALPKNERAILFSALAFLLLPVGTKLSERGATIKFGYFLNDGLASVLNVMESEKSIEVGLCGSEGFVGLPLTVGFTTSPSQTIMQIGGGGFKISAVDLSFVLRRCPNLTMALARFSQEMGTQAAQVAACNRLHGMEERLARWLLMSQDRIDGNVVPLTQDSVPHAWHPKSERHSCRWNASKSWFDYVQTRRSNNRGSKSIGGILVRVLLGAHGANQEVAIRNQLAPTIVIFASRGLRSPSAWGEAWPPWPDSDTFQCQ